MAEELTLLPCPFCGSRDVEVQGKPAILDALDSVCCNECTADAPHPVWNTRAQVPSQVGEAVAEYQQLSRYNNWDRIDKAAFDLGKLGSCPERFRALYTHPADQVADDLTMVKVSRELLDSLMTVIDSNGYAADEVEVVDELRALLAKP